LLRSRTDTHAGLEASRKNTNRDEVWRSQRENVEIKFADGVHRGEKSLVHRHIDPGGLCLGDAIVGLVRKKARDVSASKTVLTAGFLLPFPCKASWSSCSPCQALKARLRQ
jgi:hypothetical protein